MRVVLAPDQEPLKQKVAAVVWKRVRTGAEVQARPGVWEGERMVAVVGVLGRPGFVALLAQAGFVGEEVMDWAEEVGV